MYKSTKTYGHEVGISCAFRQWRAVHSHCSKLHGYAIGFKFTFVAEELDDRNWVVDFGGLKSLKHTIMEHFDHKTVVAADDPQLDKFREMRDAGILDLVIVDNVGCEKFAEIAYGFAQNWIKRANLTTNVKIESVEVFEHGANSAIYTGTN